MSSAGFTLLELLAVIFISGVLMALLFPALSAAKEKSRRSVCGDNEHQFLLVLTMYGADNNELLPAATDNQGDYHSIVLSSLTFSNILDYTYNESNILYCPNLLQAVGPMGGYNPKIGYTIGYSYLAVEDLPPSPKGPGIGWSGPLKTTQPKEVIADANYWSRNSDQSLTLAPHTSGGSVALKAAAGSSSASFVSSCMSPGSSSAAAGGMGGNIGSLDMSVIWRPIRSLTQYPASQDGTANGNW
jgi:prepilin-type N-terminal cleavage/methylation domain-containing protein